MMAALFRNRVINSDHYHDDEQAQVTARKEWEILEPLIPAISPLAVNVQYTRREMVNGIWYVLRSGCPWRMVPHDLPAWGALYYSFRTWRKEGIWDQVHIRLLKRARQREGRNEEPSAAVIDSQSIKTSAVRGPEKGFDMGKKIWGRKRHVLVDTQGNRVARQGNSGFCLRFGRKQGDA